MPQRRERTVWGLTGYQWLVIFAAWLLGYLAGFAGDAPFSPRDFVPYLLIPIAAQLFVNQVMGLYGPVWRYASVEEALRVVGAVAGGMLVSVFELAWYADVRGTRLPLLSSPPIALNNVVSAIATEDSRLKFERDNFFLALPDSTTAAPTPSPTPIRRRLSISTYSRPSGPRRMRRRRPSSDSHK